jgi:hypothetical protein
MTTTSRNAVIGDYFEHMVGKTIEEVAVFDGELIIFLSDLTEVCIYESENGFSLEIKERNAKNH